MDNCWQIIKVNKVKLIIVPKIIKYKSEITWLIGLAIICMILSLILPIYYLNYSFGDTFVQFYPYGGQYYNQYTDGFVFLTDMNIDASAILALFILLLMTIVSILVLIINLLFIMDIKKSVPLLKFDEFLELSGVLTLATPLLFAFLWTGNLNEGMGFSGNNNYMSWGPGIGWYLQLIAFILIFIAILIVYLQLDDRDRMIRY
jgi:hypothetical protein